MCEGRRAPDFLDEGDVHAADGDGLGAEEGVGDEEHVHRPLLCRRDAVLWRGGRGEGWERRRGSAHVWMEYRNHGWVCGGGGLNTPTPQERRDIAPWRHWRRPEGGMRGPHTGAVEGAVWVLGHHVVERVQHPENGRTIRGINFWNVGCGITEIKKNNIQETKKPANGANTPRIHLHQVNCACY